MRGLWPLTPHLCFHSYNKENFIYLADFPKELSIKYLANSLYGELAIVTDNEEVGCLCCSSLPRLPMLTLGGIPSACQGQGAGGHKPGQEQQPEVPGLAQRSHLAK